MEHPLMSALKRVPLFDHFHVEEIQAVAAISQEHDLAQGEYLFHEGEPAEALFVLLHGAVSVMVKNENSRADGAGAMVAELKAGAHFGEMGFLENSARSAGVLARERIHCLEIPYAELQRLIDGNPALGFKLYRNFATTLSRRVRETAHDFASLQELKLVHI